jgi:hypothetical protein
MPENGFVTVNTPRPGKINPTLDVGVTHEVELPLNEALQGDTLHVFKHHEHALLLDACGRQVRHAMVSGDVVAGRVVLLDKGPVDRSCPTLVGDTVTVGSPTPLNV